MNREEERDRAFMLNRKEYKWIVTGIGVSLVMGSVQVGISVYNMNVSDLEREQRMSAYNQTIIQLLKENSKNNVRDTTIVHIISPEHF